LVKDFQYVFEMIFKILKYALIVAITMHFLCVVIVQLYDLGYLKNSISEKIQKHYILPFFEQNWGMFAPNPPRGNQYFVVRFYTNQNDTLTINIHKKVLENSTFGLFNNNQRLLKYQNECYNDIINKISSQKLNLTNPDVSQSHGLESILNYSEIALAKQTSFLEKINDSVFIDLILVDEALSPPNSEEKYLEKSYLVLSNIISEKNKTQFLYEKGCFDIQQNWSFCITFFDRFSSV